MNVSILVSNFSRGKLFKTSLESIIPQLSAEDEIVVADDSISKDEIEQTLRSSGVNYQYIFMNNTDYRSGCKAKNVALKACKNEVIIINDPEVYHVSPCIKQIKDRLETDPKLFIVAGTMYFPNDNETKMHEFDKMRSIKHSMAPFIGGVMKEELMKVNGWDERFRFWGNDDNDLMYRLGLNGCQTHCDDEMIAVHQWHARPPLHAMGNYNEDFLYEKDKKIVANEGIEWGKL